MTSHSYDKLIVLEIFDLLFTLKINNDNQINIFTASNLSSKILICLVTNVIFVS